MARRQKTAATAFDALAIEGALIAPAMLSRIARREADGQREADYSVPRGLTLRDEIARYFRIGQAHFLAWAAGETPTATATIGFTEELLRDVFGFADISRIGSRTFADHVYAVTLEGLGGSVPVVVVPPSDDLDRATDHLPGDDRRRSAASAIQDWLNANDGALWGLCCNGERLRLVRDNSSLTRPAYIEADLRQMFEAEAFADFAALWLLLHASRFGAAGAPPAECALERWRASGAKEGVVARERLRDGFQAALVALGNGFLEDSALRERIQSGELPLNEYFGQLLRLVYRLIFLLAAEDRGLLHPPEASVSARLLYSQGYSLASLRDHAIRRSNWDAHRDRWQGLLVGFAALHRGEDRLALPALGGLFMPTLLSDLEAAGLPNRSLMEAVYRLAWLKENEALVPVNWRDMETEELGSVYEGLLELTPRIADDGRGFSFAEGSETKGNARKTTGSYYTPDSLVQALLDSTLNPVLDRVEAASENPAEALLTVTVIDPACGSGHFLLAAARRIATRVTRSRFGAVASMEDHRHALRDVVRSCIHGVDRNPMAVELTKVALWIETVEPGKPLGFLDANVRCGDALLGLFDLSVLSVGIPDDAYKPLVGDVKETAKHFFLLNRAEKHGQGSLDFGSASGTLPPPPPLGINAQVLRLLPEETAAEVEERERQFTAALGDQGRWQWQLAADLYVSAFLIPKTGDLPESRSEALVPTTGDVWQAIAGRKVYGPLVDRAEAAARHSRVFHWPIEFPDVIGNGGFDVVLGNPPWERQKLQELEFFASRDTEIAGAPTAAKRKQMVRALEASEPGTPRGELFLEYIREKRSTEALTLFCRASDRYPLSARGDLNNYALFVELASTIFSYRGAVGILVPSGIATESGTAELFGKLTSRGMLRSFYDFENRAGFFSGLHTKHKFCLLSVSAPQDTDVKLVFFANGVSDLVDVNKVIRLSHSDIALFNPNTMTLPILRSQRDLGVLRQLYSGGTALVERRAHANPWGISYLRMFDMTLDSGYFSEVPDETRVPLYEAKMFWHFDHRWASSGDDHEGTTEKSDTSGSVTSRYFVQRSEVERRLSARNWKRDWLLCYRNVSDSRNERTFVTTIVPRTGLGNSATAVLLEPSSQNYACCILGMTNALVFDYAVRQKVPAMNVNAFMVDQFPFLPPAVFRDEDVKFVTSRVLELVFTTSDLAPFARDMGFAGPPFSWNDDRRAILRAELDAFYARAYGLGRDDLSYILDPSEVAGPDYPSETFRVLKANEIKRFGEFRTARLVLQAWDRMERGEVVSETYSTTAVASPLPVQTIVPIDPRNLADSAWAMLGDNASASLAQLAALIRALPGPTPIARVRLAAVYSLEPRFLTNRLSGEARATWQRLVGPAAHLVTGTNVTALTPRIDAGWRDAVTQLRGMGAIIEDSSSQTWAAGPKISEFEMDAASWTYGRATFVLKALEAMPLDGMIGELPMEDRIWVGANAA